MAITVDSGWSPFLPHQWRMWEFRPPSGRLSIEAILGGWGSGKTESACRKFLRLALENPWKPSYGNQNPLGVCMAPTNRILRDATAAKLESIIPRQLILRKRGQPHNDLLLSNGFRIVYYSAESELEGVDACAALLDEIAHPAFSNYPRRYMNALARLRDPKSPRLGMVVSGLPESGWCRDTFDVEAPERLTLLCGMKDNPHLPPESRQAFLDSCPSGYERALIDGEWMPPQHAVYPQYREELHLVDDAGDPNVPVHIGIDIGNRGAMLIAQETTVTVRNVIGQTQQAPGLHIVDEVLTYDEGVDAQLHRLKIETPWLIRPGRSVVCVDPTSRREELAAIRKHLPGCRIVKRERSDDLYEIEAGIRLTARALEDALGNRRLLFSRKLKGKKLGIIDAMQRYRRNEATNRPIKDNSRDHVLDGLRYLVCEFLQADRPQARVIR